MELHPARGAEPARSAGADSPLSVLLTIDGILGAVLADPYGYVIDSVNLDQRDAAALSTVVLAVSYAAPPAGQPDTSPRPFATFQLQEGQIAVSAGPRLALTVVTEPGFDLQALESVMTALLADLERD